MHILVDLIYSIISIELNVSMNAKYKKYIFPHNLEFITVLISEMLRIKESIWALKTHKLVSQKKSILGLVKRFRVVLKN